MGGKASDRVPVVSGTLEGKHISLLLFILLRNFDMPCFISISGLIFAGDIFLRVRFTPTLRTEPAFA